MLPRQVNSPICIDCFGLRCVILSCHGAVAITSLKRGNEHSLGMRFMLSQKIQSCMELPSMPHGCGIDVLSVFASATQCIASLSQALPNY